MNDIPEIKGSEGLTPEQIYTMLYTPFEKSCVVQYNKLTSEEYALCPFFRQVKLLLEQIDEAGELKLTAVGNLPPKIVKAMYELGVGEWMIEKEGLKVCKETDSESVQLVRLVAEVAGVLKKRSNKLSLTATGKKLMKSDALLFEKLLVALCEKFNWGYFDGYGINGIGNYGFAFTFYLLAKYGAEVRTDNFYSNKFFADLPSVIDDKGREVNSCCDLYKLHRCYNSRVFSRILKYLGFVTYKQENLLSSGEVARTEFFDKLVVITN